MKPFRFLLFTLLAALASCSDGIEDVAPAITSYTGLALAVPQVTVSSASKTMNATQEECTAQDLYLFCYPQNGKGTFLSQELTGLTAQTDLNGDASLYNIILQPGTYHVYVVANMGEKSIGTNTDGTQKLFKNNISSLTEDQLKALTLSYTAATLPTAGNIPMVYSSDKDVVVYDGKATDVAANLTFTCAKVVVNIIFDPENIAENIKAQQPNAAEVFKNNINWLLTSVKGNNLTESTNLFTAPATSGDGALSGVALPAGKFYDNYTYNEAYKNETNKDVVTPSGAAVTKPTNARPWLYRATYYLPERSVTKEADATALPVTGTIKGGKEGGYQNTYNNISGKNLSTESTENSTNYFKLERGHYYEIVSFVNGLGQYDLPTTVDVKNWQTVELSADFLHTTLWVEKTQICTEAPLTTLTTATMTYKTNALPDDISVGCDTKVGDKGVISITNDKTTKTLTFTVNPDIPFSSYTDENKENKAKVWIQAGNIKKYIDVYYSAEPFLIVTPQEEVIYWNDADATERVKVLTFKTNLGGIKFKTGDFTASFDSNKGGSHTFGQSTITVECSSNQVAEGTITVTATSNPKSTTDHTFTVYPYTDTDGNENLAKEVKVSVHPPKGNYRIYMRAINDRQWFKGGTLSDEWAGILDEDYNSTGTTNVNNWEDGWFAKPNVHWPKDASTEYHYAYIYTQIGETKTPFDKDAKPTWIYTSGTYTWTNDDKNQPVYTHWPGDPMTADGNNPGWYYIDEAVGKKQVHVENTSEDKVITPAQTLIMFSNNTYQKEGRTLHRFNHHLEPGIPLFNFDDNEGWYLYDPLTDPYYRVFDDKPEIEDITYVIYTREYVQGWYHKYGVANDTTNPGENDMYTVWDNTLDREGPTNGWYKTTLKFKCAKGFYEKAITLCLGGSDALHPAYRVLLLNGASWTPTGKTITGYYDGSWHEGTPAGAAKRRR